MPQITLKSEFVATETFSPTCCLATTGKFTYRHTVWWEGFIKYVVEMGSDAIIHILSFIKIDSAIQKLIWGDIQIHIQHGDHMGLLLFFKNNESRLKW
jgi:hypothetical protein